MSLSFKDCYTRQNWICLVSFIVFFAFAWEYIDENHYRHNYNGVSQYFRGIKEPENNSENNGKNY